MKQNVNPAVAIVAFLVILIVVGVVAMKVFGKDSAPTKPPPDKLAEIAAQQQAMKQNTSKPGSGSYSGGGTPAEQACARPTFSGLGGSGEPVRRRVPAPGDSRWTLDGARIHRRHCHLQQ